MPCPARDLAELGFESTWSDPRAHTELPLCPCQLLPVGSAFLPTFPLILQSPGWQSLPWSPLGGEHTERLVNLP